MHWKVRPASSLAAALLDGLFEHPAWYASVIQNWLTNETPASPNHSALSLNHRIAVYKIQGLIHQDPGT